MIRFVDNQLNRITMYRLVLYYLIFLLGAAEVLSIVGVISYDPFSLLFSTGFLIAVCWTTNWVFARTFGVPSNVESAYISALILALIITPLQSSNDLWLFIWAGVLAMASKYIVAIRGKHLFNPAAFAVCVTYFAINQSASWWIGGAQLLPFVLVGGLLVVRKIRRFDVVFSFLISSFGTIIVASFLGGADLFSTLQRVVLYSPLLFFAFTLLTEPLTTPPTRKLRIAYGALVGFLFTPTFHLGGLYTTPEVALLIGNLFSYIVSPKTRLILKLKEKTQIAPDTYEFVFPAPMNFAYAPGQYMEWTLGHDTSDSRGNRRYFTLASAPTERVLRLGVKFAKTPSSFKKAMLSLDGEHEIVASQLAGDFVLPHNPRQKLVFIAGGIGITPFRSMIKYLLETHQHRPIVIFYANKTVNDIVYRDIFDRAEKELGIKTIYTVTDTRNMPQAWGGKVGRINPELIKTYAPNYKRSTFFISGSVSTINSFREILHRIGVKDTQIKVDYFSGLS